MTTSLLSHNLKQLLLSHNGLSVSELARQIDIPQPTLHHLLNGITRKPRSHVLEKLAAFFSISIQQLIGELPLHQAIPKAIKQELKLSAVPIIDWQTVSLWPQAKQTQQFKEIIVDRVIDEDAFALIMPDASMEPLFPHNALLIFDTQKQPKDRDFVLAHFTQEDKLLFNRLFIEQSGYYIKAEQLGGDIKLIKLNSAQDKILATLIEVRLKF